MFMYGALQGAHYLCPQITFEIQSPETETRIDGIQAILDTGSPFSFVPEEIINNLGRNLVYEVRRIRGVHNDVKSVRAYIIKLIIARRVFEDFKIGTIKKNYAIVGRDILNEYNITLDGPKQRWQVNIQ